MELLTSSIRDIVKEELKKSTVIHKNVTKHKFTNKNKYEVRSICVAIDKETTEQQLREFIPEAVKAIFLDDISTTYVSARQKYNNQYSARLLSSFINQPVGDTNVMFHLQPVVKESRHTTISDELIQKAVAGEFKTKKDILGPVYKTEVSEITLTISIMYAIEGV